MYRRGPYDEVYEQYDVGDELDETPHVVTKSLCSLI